MGPLSPHSDGPIKKQFFGLLVSIPLLTIGSLPVLADSFDAFQFSGFGTLGYAALDEDGVEYRLGKALDGVTDSGSFLFDSRLGVQLDAQISPLMSATVQALVRDNHEGDFAPDLEWAFLRFQLNDSWTMRIGRMSLPLFNLSDSREVGYANELIRPPEDTYVQSPLRYFDGVDVIGQFDFGETILTAQAMAGRIDEDIYNGASAEADTMVGLNIGLTKGIARVRLSQIRAPIAIDVPAHAPLIGGLQQLAPLLPAAATVANELSNTEHDTTFSGVALELDFERVFIDAEYTMRTSESFVLGTAGWYVSAGYRLGNWTPFLYYSRLEGKESAPALTLPPDPSLAPLAVGLDLIYAPPDQQTLGIGARWDFKPNMALKLQFERIQRDGIGLSFFRSDDSLTLDTGEDVNLFSFGLDFLF